MMHQVWNVRNKYKVMVPATKIILSLKTVRHNNRYLFQYEPKTEIVKPQV